MAQGFLRQPSAEADRAYLGINTNSGGSGSVTNFHSDSFSPLFTTSVTDPTTYPFLHFTSVAQSANTFYAGPTIAPNAAPTFRTLTVVDLPNISSLVRADVSATTPVLYDNTTGIFSMHVADSSHDGYLSASDWSLFNGKGSGTLTGVTNASYPNPAFATLISNSNPPVVSVKSISAGGNVTLTDNGTNVVISAANSSGGASGIDQSMAYISPYSSSTNFNLDFTYPAQTLNTPTNLIVFNYSTNWGLDNTSRVANLFIQWTNYGRLIYFAGPSTNWHVQPMVFFVPTGYGAKLQCSVHGPGESNVTIIPSIDSYPIGSNTTSSFNPTNAFPSVKLWLDASRYVYQDELTNTIATDGSTVRGWLDLAKACGALTNNTTASLTLNYHTPNSGIFNVPSVQVSPGVSWLSSSNVTAIAQPTWGFIMFYGRGGGGALDASTGTRFSCNPVEVLSSSGSFFCGSGLSFSGPAKLQWALFSFLGNGNTSIVRTNGAQLISGIAGAGQPTGWLFGGDNTKAASISTFHVAEVLILNTNLTAAQLTNVESYFYRKYPFWTPPTVQ